MHDLVTVIVPVFNVERYIDRCVSSIVNQSYNNLEIILVDDGSTDKSSALCEQWKVRDSRIIVIHKANGGLSDARNAGISLARGRYLSFIDGDDEIDALMIEHLYKAISTYECDISICRMKKIENYRVFITRDFPSSCDYLLLDSEEAIRLLLLNKIDCSACLKLYKKELFKNLRFPLGKTNEDFSLMYKLFFYSERLIYISEPLYNYYYRENSITTTPFSNSQFDKIYNAEEMVSFIDSHCKSLNKEALYYLNLQSFYLLKTIILNKYQINYKKEYKHLLNVLRKSTIFISECKWISNREKITYLVIAWTPFLYSLIKTKLSIKE